MRLRTKKILGIDVTTSPKEDILEKIKKYLEKSKDQKPKIRNKSNDPLVVFTPNPEIITYAQKDADFRRIVNTSQINLPDGTGICWALRKLHGISVERLSGADLMLDLVKLAHRDRFRIGLIGGREKVAVSVLDCLKRKYPGLQGVAFEAPEVFFGNKKSKNIDNTKYLVLTTHERQTEETKEYFEALIDEIKKKKVDILFIALGHPKQEYFIENTKCQMSNVKCDRPLVIMAVGGAFDYIAGKVPRAPKWARDRGLEWLYRLVREPWRFGRQLKGAEFFLILHSGNEYR